MKKTWMPCSSRGLYRMSSGLLRMGQRELCKAFPPPWNGAMKVSLAPSHSHGSVGHGWGGCGKIYAESGETECKKSKIYIKKFVN